MEFTHFDDQGNALMVDVGDKAETKREAVASPTFVRSPGKPRPISRQICPTTPRGMLYARILLSTICFVTLKEHPTWPCMLHESSPS